jgi:hypothetical protein
MGNLITQYSDDDYEDEIEEKVIRPGLSEIVDRMAGLPKSPNDVKLITQASNDDLIDGNETADRSLGEWN